MAGVTEERKTCVSRDGRSECNGGREDFELVAGSPGSTSDVGSFDAPPFEHISLTCGYLHELYSTVRLPTYRCIAVYASKIQMTEVAALDIPSS